MALNVGSRLGHYDVTALIGEGGMGQVYQATDTKLNRQVALKILPEAFAADPDRLARFQREAQVLASLNHPNIAQIHGLEESEGTRALVLELVEGPTLADRIAQGAIPLDEALPIAKQIAEALEAAHEAGVIHRDLKPANIKVRDDGTVKVLDFGLAKALDTTPEGDPSQSPTLTAAATQMGVILGTAAYMSPEQARGKTVDRRADIWAFGVVLYEMLTGVRPFQGEDVSLTLASVMKSDVDVRRLPPDLPETLRTVLHRCLEKDPLQRIRDMGDVRLAMEGAFETTVSTRSDPTAAPQFQVWQRPIPATIVAVVLVAITGLAVWGMTRPDVIPADLMRFTIVPTDTAPFSGVGLFRDLAITRDGTQIVYQSRASDDGQRQLILRPIDQFGGVPLRGGAGASPFVSPDGEWVGSLASSTTVQKESIFGGPPVALTESPNPIVGASWGADEQIIFGTLRGGLLRVSGGGGEPETLTTLDTEQGENGHLWPFSIPGRKAVVFVITAGLPLSTGQLAVLDLNTGDVTRLGLTGVSPHYVSTGHLVYAAADGSVRAVPFDASLLAVTGNPVPLVEGVAVKASGAANFSISDNGRLVYVLGASAGGAGSFVLALIDRDGNAEPLDVPPQAYFGPRLSPDGTRLAVEVRDEGGSAIFVYDMSGNTAMRRLTQTSEGSNRFPLWTPDGERVTFVSDRDGLRGIYWQFADGTDVAEALFLADEDVSLLPTGWSPDERTLAFTQGRDPGFVAEGDIWTLSLESGTAAEPVLFYDDPENAQVGATFSPDGNWIAYRSDSSPSSGDVYVQPVPPTGRTYRVTEATTRAFGPRWSADGTELFYQRGGQIAAVDVETIRGFQNGAERLLPVQGFFAIRPYRDYDVTPDSQQFLVAVPVGQADSDASATPQINIVLNWFEELKERVPTP